MTAFSRPLAVIFAALIPLAATSAASAMSPAITGVQTAPSPGASSPVLKVNDGYRYHRRYYHGRHVVHAPFTRVESGHHTVVDAPFVHVHSGRRGNHIVAPFVDLWRLRGLT